MNIQKRSINKFKKLKLKSPPINKNELLNRLYNKIDAFKKNHKATIGLIFEYEAINMPYWVIVHIDQQHDYDIRLFKKSCKIIFKNALKIGIMWNANKMLREFFKEYSFRQPNFLLRDFNST